MPMRLTLIAHGATAATRRAAVPRDEPLEERAMRRAVALGRGLRGADRVLVSPALRARQTAERLGLAAEIDEALRDCDCGLWAGLSLDEVAGADPDGLAQWLSDPDFAGHGGEPVTALLARVAAWLNAQASGTASRVIAITHGAVIRAAILHALAAPAASFWRIDVAPLSRTELTAFEGRWNFRGMTTGKP